VNCHLQKGKRNEIAFVFSCPGEKEENEGKPAAGITGNNLSELLKLLNKKLVSWELSREQITITNVWTKIEYKNKTNRTEADDNEIISSDNLKRLREELIIIEDLIIYSGKKAMLGVCQIQCNLNKHCQIIYIEHLGTRGLNNIKNDVNGKEILAASKQLENGDSRSLKEIQNNNTFKRLEIICQNIAEQLKNKKEL